ncbi:nitrogenase molybdenum-iron cofactor biosynthesis protein NifN [Hydrogenobacter thermophilus TK-6]|uniref:Nitrogenase iron-molybdenum cofactor biosynthesis protein NifN n=1 Tax=Hydrogenobacter thermophilus (strain DSM 6534 / IAM 12695 / TK-6) TaxID=608538 RepID=D3DIE5_HYDTT|nr:nitrogenase iron-molybdenum cofactor biosynthesis protein NifN [Hydrogenobacter thermophilus]ADO45523.1 nitrogenase molybdenum-iron cofactor biosynthesis protein NifN [Hydrogenobacter thermophilus TK-6]BAI69597.1 nitrogenase iron-molybdenum cofactor biosynthesis protein [Hydrogenobacter thermophilus TK-6]
MAVLRKSNKACSVYPLKLSQPLGAVYFFLGIKGSIPLMHGSQGCAAFAKTFLTRNFSENIPMQTTALSEIATVMGGDDNLHIALKNIIERYNPELIGIVSTGVSETKGDDVEGSIKRFKELYPDYVYKKLIYVSTPDYEGSFHDGYKKAILSTVKTLVRRAYSKKTKRINVLLSYSLTAKDVDTIKEVIESFGLKPIILPNFSSSLDGGSKGFSSITAGGTDVEEIEFMSASAITITVGESTKEAGEYLESKFMIPAFYFESLYGLKNFDRFIRLLMNLSGEEPDEKLKKWRSRLLDAMLDSHFYLTGKKIAIAAEPDTLYGISDFLVREIGMEVSLAVASTYAEYLKQLPFDEIIIGDLEDMLLLKEGKCVDIAIGNTNMRHIAKKLKVPHYRMGIPVFDRLGHFLKGFVGYEGSINLVFDLANLLMGRDEEESYKIPEHITRRST